MLCGLLRKHVSLSKRLVTFLFERMGLVGGAQAKADGGGAGLDASLLIYAVKALNEGLFLNGRRFDDAQLLEGAFEVGKPSRPNEY